MTLAPKNIDKGFLQLFLSLLLALSLTFIDGNDFISIRKFTASEFIVEHRDMLSHIAFIENRNPLTRFIIMAGTCEVLSAWPVLGKVDARVPIPRQLQREFDHHKIKNVSVLNLAVGGYAVTHNLHVFLRFMNDPRCRAYLWQNDFNPFEPEQNHLIFNTDVYKELTELKKTSDLPEIDLILRKMDEAQRTQKVTEETDVAFPSFPDRTIPGHIIHGFFSNAKYLATHLFQIDQNVRIRENTFYIRQMVKKIDLAFRANVAYVRDADDILVRNEPLPKRKPGLGRALSDAEVIGDNILTLRLMGKLAALHGQRIYVYFGPEGRAPYKPLTVYARQFKAPIVKAAQDLPAIKIIDLVDIRLEPGDLWGVNKYSLVHPTYSGAQKISKALFEVIQSDEKINLQ